MEKKLFIIKKFDEFSKYEQPTTSTICTFYGTEEDAKEITRKFNSQNSGWSIWLEAWEISQISNVNEVLELSGYVFPMEKTLFLYFFKEPDGIYVYKRRPDRTEKQAKPVAQKISYAGFEFASTLRGLKRNGIDKDTGKEVEWNVVVHYRRADNIIDVEEFEQIAKDIEFKDKLKFRSE